MSAQFEHPDFPREIADAPDIDNVPAASSMHTLMGAVAEIHTGVRQILESMSPEATAERARVIAPLAMELARELEQPAPSLLDQDGDDDGREAAPLDLVRQVKAGDAVTLKSDGATLETEVAAVHELPFNVIAWTVRGGLQIKVTGPDAWALTAHQPAPEPEPEWELEQVAEISFRGCHAAPLTTLRAIRTDAGWRTVNGDWADVNVESARPLVVIDPEAVDVVELAKAAWDRWDGQPADTSSNAHFRDVVRAVLAKVGLEAAR
jgi:hypothetical protein